jgi:putative phosphoesterase
MLIALFSDSHDNLMNIQAALREIIRRGITLGLHLGDICGPEALELLANSGLDWKCVWGNMDLDRASGYTAIKQCPAINIPPEDFREVFIANRVLFLTHFPDLARIAALSGKYDAVFHGHTHHMFQDAIFHIGQLKKETLLANPGELCGTRFGIPSFGIYDTERNTFTIVRI